MLNRIQRVIDYHKMTSSAFADSIGVPRSTISHILSGRNNPSLDFVMKILARFPQIHTDWLLHGIGPMLKVSNSLFADDNLDYVGDDIAPENEQTKAEDEIGSPPPPINLIEFAANTSDLPSEAPIASENKEDYLNIVRSEPPAEYVTSAKSKENKASKVIVLYADGTFSEFNPR